MKDLRKVSRALISVADKRGLAEFAQSLHSLGVELIATGGTRSIIEGGGVPVKRLKDVARRSEVLEGRVKTLQLEVFAAILAKREEDHLKELRRLEVEPIDMVVCNFYPFEEVSSKEGVGYDEVLENIDIGGPSLVRAAAKNHEYVTVVPSTRFYDTVVEELSRNRGYISAETRRRLAQAAFEIVASYDIAICSGLRRFTGGTGFAERFFISATKFEDAKYGENPDQMAAVYRIDGFRGMLDWRQLFGDSRSFNNHLDIGRAYALLEGFEYTPAAATVKHGNISGFALAPTPAEAYRLAHSCDPEADYGGVVVLNRRVDVEAARLIGKNPGDETSVYTEILVAPGYDEEALEILKAKQTKKIRIIEAKGGTDYPYDVRVLEGALLVQTPADYRRKLDRSILTYPTRMKPDAPTLEKLLTAWEVVRKVESNGIVVAEGRFKDGRLTHFWTLGVGSFRKRNGAIKIALDNAGERARGAVAASDGFFPFSDDVELLAEAGVKAVIQPGGSIRDRVIVETADRYGLAMVFTHTRAFKH